MYTNISPGRGDGRWVQAGRVAPTLLNIQWTPPEDQVTCFSQHTLLNTHTHTHTLMQYAHTRIMFMSASTALSHMHPKWLQTGLTSCTLSWQAAGVTYVLLLYHGKNYNSNCVSAFIQHTCTQRSTSIRDLTHWGQTLFNLVALLWWTDTHTYRQGLKT